MAKIENTNSKAEAYREERKKRIAKAAKQSNKGTAKIGGPAKVFSKIIAIVLVVAIVGAVAWRIVDMTGVVERSTTILTVSLTSDPSQKVEISAAEFNYMFYSQYSSIVSQVQNNGTDYGFDTTLPLEDQTTTDESGATITWAAAFKTYTIESLKQQYMLVLEAKSEKFALSEEDKTTIDTNIESLRTSASQANYSLNAYLKQQYGNGINEKLFRSILENQTIAEKFANEKSTKLMDSPTDEAIEAEYGENQKLYNVADVRYKVMALTTLPAKEGETEAERTERQTAADTKVKEDFAEYYSKVDNIEAFLAADEKYEADKAKEAADAAADDDAKDTEETTFEYDSAANLYTNISYSNLETAAGTEAADWAFDSGRKAGEVKTFESDKALTIVCSVKSSFASNSVDVRDCLISFNAEDESNPTAEEKEAAKASAQEIYDAWSEGDKTIETFTASVKENSNDTNTAEAGGLYDNLRLSASTFGDDINNWIFDSSRKAGDCEILEGKDGYHIIYFVSNNTDDVDWKVAIKSNLGSKAVSEYQETALGGTKYTSTPIDKKVTKYQEKCCKRIKDNLLASAAVA